MPQLWSDTIATHRRAVRDAIVDTTWVLVAEHGLLSVTMKQVAEATGIGRATLYKYFPDVESILMAHHERHIAEHLERLRELGGRPGTPSGRLGSVLHEFARICFHRGRHADEVAALVHRGRGIAEAEDQVRSLIGGLISAASEDGVVRTDVKPRELAGFCVHALSGASELPSEAAVRRLVAVTFDGLRPRDD